tara:strand:+ start:1613 stop:2446 length:834 start_codon:yes stop_codon:yes gene_type:complete
MFIKNIFVRIINNLIKPHKLPIKIFNKLNYYLNYRKYDQSFFEKKQNDIFNHYGLNREEGIKNLDSIKKFNINLITNKGLGSEHEIIFSSLSVNKNRSINDILEIGTFDGFNALLLSSLFPSSNIDTIDLPENDEDFINFYNRKNNADDFVKDRNNTLSKNKKINFFPMSSLKLLNQKKKYDLIWIDGAHGYPVVCIDIINSLHILKENGLILCDDVFLNLNHRKSSTMYSSIASFETLNELKKQNLINFKLAFKRLHPKNNCLESKRKFIAIVNKI